jgi:hypothetical protein
MMYCDDSDIARFAERWGGLDQETFLRAYEHGSQEEHLIALFALGLAPETPHLELIRPLLQSSDPFERWASALILGENHDEQALPVLVELLTEIPDAPPGSVTSLFDYWRMSVASCLGNWQQPVLAPAFREAYRLGLQRTNILSSEQIELHEWFLGHLAYALGQIEAFGALWGLPLTEVQQRVAMVHLTCGFLQSGTRYGYGILSWTILNGFDEHAEFRAQVLEVLVQRFGVMRDDVERMIKYLYRDVP